MPKAVLKVAAAEALRKASAEDCAEGSKTKSVCETTAETPARFTGVKRGTMDSVKTYVLDHVEEANSLRVRMTMDRQQELLLGEARKTLRNHAILSNKKRKAERAKHGKPRIPIEALRKAFGD